MKTCSICGAQCQDAQVECLSCGNALPVAGSAVPAPVNLLDAWRSLKIAHVGTRDPLTLFVWELLREVPLFKVADALGRVKATVYAARGQNGQAMTDNTIAMLWCTAIAEEIKALGK